MMTVSSQSKNQRNSPAVQSQTAVLAISSPLRECRETRATGSPAMIHEGSIGASAISRSSGAPATSGACGNGAMLGICRNIIAAAVAIIIFKAIAELLPRR